MTKCFHEIGAISLVKILEKYTVEAMREWSFPYEKDVSLTHTHHLMLCNSLHAV